MKVHFIKCITLILLVATGTIARPLPLPLLPEDTIATTRSHFEAIESASNLEERTFKDIEDRTDNDQQIDKRSPNEISYGALRADGIHGRKKPVETQANPYSRGCLAISRCRSLKVAAQR